MGNVVNMGYGTSSETGDALSGHDEYIQRLGADDLKRYTEGFRRVCRVENAGDAGASADDSVSTATTTVPSKAASKGRSSAKGGRSAAAVAVGSLPSVALNKKLFRSKIMSAFPLIPHSLSDRLFEVLDSDQRGELTVDKVLRGVALLKHGTKEEHMQLLFTVYDLDTTGLVSRDVLDRFMDVIYGRKKARHATTVSFLNGIFGERSTLTMDEFKEVVYEKDVHGDPLLVQWLYVLAKQIGRNDDKAIVELEKQYNPVAVRHQIADSTQFSTTEVSTLEKQFHRIFDTKGGTSNRIPSDQFIEVLERNEFPRGVLERACRRVLIPGMILFDEFCQFVSDFCRGREDARCQHLFTLFVDEEESSRISKQAVEDLVNICSKFLLQDDTEAENQTSLEQSVEEAHTTIQDVGYWDEQHFLLWARDSVIIRQLLHQMAFAACILFGIKPESGHLEKRIVMWHWKHATKQFEVGHSWNFIATKWWAQWCRFVGMNEKNGTPQGRLVMPRVPSEASVQKQSADSADTTSRQDTVNGVTRPGPIANWSLLKRSGSRRLKENMVIGRDFHLVPASVHATLVQWYSGGPDLPRSIVELANGVLQLELFPLVLRVARVDPANGGVIMSGEEVLLSSLSTVNSLLHATCKALLLTKHVDRARLWHFDENHPDRKYRLRDSHPKELLRMSQSSVFLLEVQDDDGSWPLSQMESGTSREGDSDENDDSVDVVDSPNSGVIRKRPRDSTSLSPVQRRTSELCSRGNLDALTGLGSTKSSAGDVVETAKASGGEDEGYATAKTLKRRFSRNAFTGSGLVGLDNLGNTCYMSSALQCLSHTRLLVDYFKNEEYLHDINLHNRDGTNGKLAIAFGELLRVLWTSEKKRFAPTEFKRVLARFNPQFSGADQHDAQELLACLLSALSEDLNRVVTKPYIEQPDSDGRSDSIVAEEWWLNHLKRELSVIVALFTGQYKSLLECSICHFESARFEPFTFLQLSLPESSFRSVVVTVIFNSGRVPMKYSARVRNDGTIQDVIDEVEKLIQKLDAVDQVLGKAVTPATEKGPSQVAIARVSSIHTIETILDARTSLNRIHERDHLTAFQLDPVPEDKSRSISFTEFTQPGVEMNGHHGVTQGKGSGTDLTGSPASSPAESDRQTTISDHEESSSPSVHRTGSRENLAGGPYPLGTSVYVRVEKTKEFLPARVIGGDTKNSTVDVAFPTGVRRYHITLPKVVERRRDEAFIFLVHRRIEQSVNSFTEVHMTRLFGAPLTLRVSMRFTTNYDLYMLVWRRLHRIFNWQVPPSPSEVSAYDGEEPPTEEDLRTDISRLALGSHLGLTKFGFCLRMVTSHGIGCSRCEWINGCLGCVILPSSTERISLAAEETIAIDWDVRTLKEEYDHIQASKLDVDESVQSNHRLDNMPLNIDRCLDIFTAKENIQEAYCGRCKTLRPATKTMDLWRLPPILVIQLKRFCYTQTSRRKLHHFVDFPLTGLRLDDFVAKEREPRRMHQSGLIYWQFLGGKLKSEPTMNGNGTHASSQQSDGARNASGSWLETPATATDRSDASLVYDLYAVVNHVGALGGGHYFAYVLSEDDGKWKCFNDHQCKDIDAKEVVSSTAYILFYRRRDMKDAGIEELFPPIRRNKGAKDEDEDVSEDQAKVEELVEQTKNATNNSGCTIS
ncbi:hypothetical protein Poli38472_003048 [Pythium oligandrum]|uniref:ubiquitinyl hydrolase 1 n=1 Tax=Pythium oligandrum TaxID=41045 RepID=A0A8K1C643_PYTOL|nr:hypothetical protein Poli38472_003048 [Pythium oligandrum]|eukprot:TMW57123.1 hypothetical protein Poli38472_003048 [Pythium oligandrum]